MSKVNGPCKKLSIHGELTEFVLTFSGVLVKIGIAIGSMESKPNFRLKGGELVADTIGVTTRIPQDTHERLMNVAKSRKIDLKILVARVLDWASTQSPTELISHGVNIPLWPAEIDEIRK